MVEYEVEYMVVGPSSNQEVYQRKYFIKGTRKYAGIITKNGHAGYYGKEKYRLELPNHKKRKWEKYYSNKLSTLINKIKKNKVSKK